MSDTTPIDYLESLDDDEIIEYLVVKRKRDAVLEQLTPSDLFTNDLIQEIEMRGFKVIENCDEHEVESVVQLHRTCNPLWEQKAIDLIYSMSDRII